MYGSWMDMNSLDCKGCGRKFEKKYNLLLHMGVAHNVVNAILIQRGLESVKPKRRNHKHSGERHNENLESNFLWQYIKLLRVEKGQYQ